MQETIQCKYSCTPCGVYRIVLTVPARQQEDVKEWVDATVIRIVQYHRTLHPHCQNNKLDELMIPIGTPDGMESDRIGGAMNIPKKTQ